MELTMRIARESDLKDIVAIYNSTVPTRLATADTKPVTVESKLEWFRQHAPDSRPLMVHEQDGKIAAWVSFQSFYGRPAYQGTAEISIYVAETFQHQGLGRQLLKEALEMTGDLGIKHMVGFIFSHNTPSLKLFKSFGFEQWGRLPDIAEMDGREYSLSILGKRVTP